MKREEALSLVSSAIGDRDLIWFGQCGEDTVPLLDLPQFSHASCEYAAVKDERINTISLEAIAGRRGAGSMTSLSGPGQQELMSWLRSAAKRPALVMNAAPSDLIEMVLKMSPRLQRLGISLSAFKALSDKTSLEAALARDAGLKVIPYRELPDSPDRTAELREALREGPIVVRSSTIQSAGSGHHLIETEEDLATSRIAHRRETISVAPYLGEHIPFSVSSCVFPDGGVTKHQPCGSITGQPFSTSHRFGRSGNDYGLVHHLSPTALDKMEEAADRVGKWLLSQGYVGAFSFQGRILDEDIYYVEISPRFGGRSRISADADRAIGLADFYLDHIMACLGMESYRSVPLREIVPVQRRFGQALLLNMTGTDVRLKPEGLQLPDGFWAERLADPQIIVEPGAYLCMLLSDHGVAVDTLTFTDETNRVAQAAVEAFEPVAM